MYDRKAFKKEAKELMRGSKPHFMLVALVYWLLTTALSTVASELGSISGLGAGVLSTFLSILVGLFSMVMSVGFVNYGLRLSRKQETGMNSLFCGFSFAGRSIGLNILVAVYTFLWAMLLVVGFSVILAVLALAIGDLTALFVVAVVILYIVLIVLVYAIVLRYAMSTCALADDPEGGVSAAIRRSVQIMKGNKKKYFVLLLSFIGWELLIGLISGVIVGIGFIACDTAWFFESIALLGEDMTEIYTVMTALSNQLWLWTLLSELVALPLSLWLAVYQQTTIARFYNHVGGYDYCQSAQAQENAPVIPLEQSGPEKPAEPPVQPPVGGYYTPPVQDAPTQEPETPDEDETEEI